MKLHTCTHILDKGWQSALPENKGKDYLILIFASFKYLNNADVTTNLQQEFPNATIIGCSTAGDIQNENVLDDALVATWIDLSHSHFQLNKIHVENASASEQSGRELVKPLIADDLKAVLVLSDGLNVNGSALIQGINTTLPKEVIVTGGLAGDDGGFIDTWVLVDGEMLRNTALAVGFYGEHIHINAASQGGWKIFGPDRIITKSEGNVLYELDNQPALKLYKEYLGELSQELPASGLLYPLEIETDGSGVKLVRTILAVDEAAQSLTFAGDMPEGLKARLMFATIDNLVDGAEQAAMQLQKEKGDEDMLAIAISCVGRRMVMEEDPTAELEATLDCLPDNTHQVGFYSFGELSPYENGTRCDLHNQTMTLTTIHEST